MLLTGLHPIRYSYNAGQPKYESGHYLRFNQAIYITATHRSPVVRRVAVQLWAPDALYVFLHVPNAAIHGQ